MRYPILIKQDAQAARFGVVVPDLPGCFSAGVTLAEAIAGVREAAAAWILGARQRNMTIPPASSVTQVQQLSAYRGWAVDFIELPAVPRATQ